METYSDQEAQSNVTNQSPTKSTGTVSQIEPEISIMDLSMENTPNSPSNVPAGNVMNGQYSNPFQTASQSASKTPEIQSDSGSEESKISKSPNDPADPQKVSDKMPFKLQQDLHSMDITESVCTPTIESDDEANVRFRKFTAIARASGAFVSLSPVTSKMDRTFHGLHAFNESATHKMTKIERKIADRKYREARKTLVTSGDDAYCYSIGLPKVEQDISANVRKILGYRQTQRFLRKTRVKRARSRSDVSSTIDSKMSSVMDNLKKKKRNGKALRKKIEVPVFKPDALGYAGSGIFGRARRDTDHCHFRKSPAPPAGTYFDPKRENDVWIKPNYRTLELDKQTKRKEFDGVRPDEYLLELHPVRCNKSRKLSVIKDRGEYSGNNKVVQVISAAGM